MKMTYCNPLDLGYRYSHMKEQKRLAHREGADPTLVFFKGMYYAFVSMSAGFWYSKDLLNWEFHSADDLLIYDYAPDVRQIGDYLYFCASKRAVDCPILRTKDPLTEAFEQISAPFPFWDPDLFQDDDGRVYLYWGCTNTDPIWGVEMDPETMTPIGEKVPLVYGREGEVGFERPGDNGKATRETSVVYQHLKHMFNPATNRIEFPGGLTEMGGYSADAMTAMFLAIGKPYIEGAYMTKHDGRYYLQYACPGTQYNTYADGVYVGEHPLGPFTLQSSNPYSSKPGGFITAAGHGSTIQDAYGNWWHASTMRISINHDFERRIGLFPAGFDADGVMYCNQNFADYPHEVPQGRFDAAAQQPKWMLLSYNKPVTASSGTQPERAVNENIRDWWSADSAAPGEWLCVDLDSTQKVHAIQVNLADEALAPEFPDSEYGSERGDRRIELAPQISHYTIECSLDGVNWTLLENVARECSNGYYEYADGICTRFIRVTGGKLPYGQVLRISGLRVFGFGGGEKAVQAQAKAERTGPMEAHVTWAPIPGAQGCNVRYGIAPDKLYMSWLVYGADEVTLTTLIQGQEYYVCVDSFNENGITPGNTIKVV